MNSPVRVQRRVTPMVRPPVPQPWQEKHNRLLRKIGIATSLLSASAATVLSIVQLFDHLNSF